MALIFVSTVQAQAVRAAYGGTVLLKNFYASDGTRVETALALGLPRAVDIGLFISYNKRRKSLTVLDSGGAGYQCVTQRNGTIKCLSLIKTSAYNGCEQASAILFYNPAAPRKRIRYVGAVACPTSAMSVVYDGVIRRY